MRIQFILEAYMYRQNNDKNKKTKETILFSLPL